MEEKVFIETGQEIPFLEERLVAVFGGLDKSYAETIEHLDSISQNIPFLAKNINVCSTETKNYFEKILSDIEFNRAKKKSMNTTRVCEMAQALNNIKLDKTQVVLVNTETGKERKFIHYWAEQNGLLSAPIRCNFFSSVYIYRCRECGFSFYHDEISKMDYDGNRIKQIISCKYCDGMYDEDPEFSDIVCNKGFNCVVIGKTLPPLSKWCSRRKQKEKSLLQTQIKDIDLKQIRILDKKDFIEQMDKFIKKQQQKHTMAKMKRKAKNCV